jgi:hypothetical protein
MDFVFDLLQGVGIAAAIGVRPFLPALLVGVLASADAGLDFDGTDFAFLESVPFLVGMALLSIVAGLYAEPRGDKRGVPTAVVYGLAVASVVLGALMAAGSLDDRGHTILPGIVLGAAAAILGFLAARSLFTRVRRRLDPEAARALPVYAEGAASAGAGLSILFPPLAVLVLAALAWLLVAGRRREGEKYAGLRVLR